MTAPGVSGDDGPATAAELNRPQAVAIDAAGDLLIADNFNDRADDDGLSRGHWQRMLPPEAWSISAA